MIHVAWHGMMFRKMSRWLKETFGLFWQNNVVSTRHESTSTGYIPSSSFVYSAWLKWLKMGVWVLCAGRYDMCRLYFKAQMYQSTDLELLFAFSKSVLLSPTIVPVLELLNLRKDVSSVIFATHHASPSPSPAFFFFFFFFDCRQNRLKIN